MDNIYLDCHNKATTLDSLSKLFEISTSDIENSLIEFDLNFNLEKINYSKNGDNLLLQYFEKEFSKQKKTINYIFWFHFTRTFTDCNYSEGILPLNDSLKIILKKLKQIFIEFDKQGKNNNSSKNNDNTQFLLKTNDLYHSGPFAMLVRETALHAEEMGNTNYLKMPEIIVDICEMYYNENLDEIINYLKIIMRPCIIKFWSINTNDLKYIKPALYYCYNVLHNNNLTIDSNTCFDGHNCKIDKSQIVNIEFLKNNKY